MQGLALHTQLPRGRWFSEDEEKLLLRYAGHLRGIVIEQFPNKASIRLSRKDISRKETFKNEDIDNTK
jgi:hypothetical protein